MVALETLRPCRVTTQASRDLRRGRARLWMVAAGAALVGYACSEGTSPDVDMPPMGDPQAEPDVVTDAPAPVPLNLEDLDCGEINPVPSEGRLLTRLQYENTVSDLFHGQVLGPHTAGFPLENEVLGFFTNAEFHRVSPWLAEAHLGAAEGVSDQVVAKLSELLPCSVAPDDEAACANEFLNTYGSRAFRRPLSDEERAPLLALFESGRQQAGFSYGAQLMTQALLQSPQFLYRLELSAPSDAVTPSAPVTLGNYDLASRLSYLLWNSMPDETLFAAASSGALSDPSVLGEQARRMLADPRARATVTDFSRQWLRMTEFSSVVRQSEFGEDHVFAPAWRRSLELFLDDVFWGGEGTFAELFLSPQVFVNEELAPMYGVAVPSDHSAGQFFAASLNSEERAGILTQPGLMTLLAHADQSAPILRGVFLRERILCQPPPAAPPSVDQTPPRPDPNATTRERFAAHTADPTCAGCHRLIDTVGLPFENYDHLGRFRAEENGLPVDVSGEVLGTREPAIEGPFSGAVELSQRLSTSSQAQACYVTQWYRYGMGRIEQEADLCSIRTVLERFQASGGDLEEVLVSLVLSDSFRYRKADATETTELTAAGLQPPPEAL